MSQYKLREMLSRVKGIGVSHVISWTAMHQMRSDPERIAKQMTADNVAHHIAGEVMRNGTWRVTAEPDGQAYDLKGYWLTYDELYRLLEDAYSLGRAERPIMELKP